MKLIYTHENRLLVSNVQNILENAGVAVVIKNEFAGSASGDLSFLSTWPEVWVLNDDDYEKSIQIVDAALSSQNNVEWNCSNCKEVNAASFDLCWNCQAERTI